MKKKKTNENMLKSVARGGFFFMVGRFAEVVLRFTTGIFIIRMLEKNQYGLLSLGTVMMGIAVSISILGFQNGIPRLIAGYQLESDVCSVGKVIFVSLLTTFVMGTGFSILLYFGAPFIAVWLPKPGIVPVLKIFGLMVLPVVLSRNMIAVFRGLENPRPKVYFEDIGKNALNLIFILTAFYLGARFEGILYCMVASAWVSFVLLCIYSLRSPLRQFNIHDFEKPDVNHTISAEKEYNRAIDRIKSNLQFFTEMVKFSIPLMGVQLLNQFMGWTAVIILGIMSSTDQVASYHASLRLVLPLTIPLASSGYLYLPIATRLYLKGRQEGLHNLYVNMTKWIFLFTLPLTFFGVFESEWLATWIFGSAYQQSGYVLAILIFGFSLNAWLGPNTVTLITFGKNKTVLCSTVIGLIATSILSLMLAPKFGAIGVAFGTTLAIVVSNIYKSISLYYFSRIHPFTMEYMKPVGFTVALSTGACLSFRAFGTSSPVVYGLLFISLVFISLISPFITGTVTDDDLNLLRAMVRRVRPKTGLTET